MMSWSYQTPSDLSETQYELWERILEERTGIHFAQHKSILQTGLIRRMREIGVDNYNAYFQRIIDDEGSAEWNALVCSLTVKETSFFRDPDAYQLVRKHLKYSCPAERESELVMWSVGCSTGEEAYSLAISARETLEYNQSSSPIRVIGTDISQAALDTAIRGEYAARKIEKLKPVERNRYFDVSGPGTYRVSESIRKDVSFLSWNIIEDEITPVYQADVIFCQNVLIYFRQEKKEKILNNLADRLKPGGLLVVGSGEITGWKHSLMERVDSSVQAYIRVQKNN